MFNKIVRAGKKLYYEHRFEAHKNNIKKTWQILNEITKKTKDKSSVIEEIKIGDKLVSDPEEIANTFNEFFATIGDKNAEKLAPTNKKPENYLTGNFPNNFFINPTTPEEVINYTKKLKTKYSCDHLGISSAFIKKLFQQ